MSERIFYKNFGPFKLSEIAKKLSIEIDKKHNDLLINDIKSLEKSNINDITFLSNIKYHQDFLHSKASVCIVEEDFESKDNHPTPILLRSKNPYYSFALLNNLFYGLALPKEPVIMQSSNIGKNVKIGKNCYIGHNVTIEDEAEIGDNSIIEAGSFIGYRVVIGQRAKIDPNCVITNSIIGDDFIAFAGAKIGQEGFGFATHSGKHLKIYHVGRVLIGDDVEVGANSTIDRGSANDTMIEDGCRIDNLVQIGHNAHIGKGSILVAQVGVAGSSSIGDYCALGGQVGVAGHLKIASGTQIAGQGGVIQNIDTPGVYAGTPTVPIRDWHKQTITLKKMIQNRNK